MRIESSIPGRIRIKFDNLQEKSYIDSLISKLDGIKEFKSTSTSILINYDINTEADFVLRNLKSKEEHIKIEMDDVYYYTVPFIKNPAMKAMYSIMLLGFKRGLITFGICSLFLAKYLKSKFG